MTAVRRATVDDVEAMLSLWRVAEATPSPTDNAAALIQAIESPAAAVLVAMDAEGVVGSVVAGFDGWRGNLYRLAVHPRARRRGIARRLVAAAEAELRAMGASRISALVEREHAEAVAFWEAAGYALDARIARYVRHV